MIIHDLKIRFCKNSCTFTVSGLKEDDKIKPKMYTKAMKLQF